MIIRMEAVVLAIKKIIETGQEEEFCKKCNESGMFITANKDLIRLSKLALHRAELSMVQPASKALARSAAYERESDTCEYVPKKGKK